MLSWGDSTSTLYFIFICGFIARAPKTSSKCGPFRRLLELCQFFASSVCAFCKKRPNGAKKDFKGDFVVC